MLDESRQMVEYLSTMLPLAFCNVIRVYRAFVFNLWGANIENAQKIADILVNVDVPLARLLSRRRLIFLQVVIVLLRSTRQALDRH